MDKEQFDNTFKPMLREKNIIFSDYYNGLISVKLHCGGEVDVDFEGNMTIYEGEDYGPHFLHKETSAEIVTEIESLLEESNGWT